MITDRQEYVELETVEDAYARLGDWNIFQVKYDGIWARVVIENGTGEVYSRTGQLKTTFVFGQRDLLPVGRTVLIGEYMYGSQWAQHQERKGKFYVFDCVEMDAAIVSDLPYKQRYAMAESVARDLRGPFEMVKCLGKQHLGGFWLSHSSVYEGVVLRKWEDPYAAKLLKLKFEVEDDFIIMGYVPGQGKYDGSLGALIVGQYDATDTLVEVMRVGGGFDDEFRQLLWNERPHFLGKVCLVRGKSRFESGALRHPNFSHIRADKPPFECRIKTTLS